MMVPLPPPPSPPWRPLLRCLVAQTQILGLRKPLCTVHLVCCKMGARHCTLCLPKKTSPLSLLNLKQPRAVPCSL